MEVIDLSEGSEGEGAGAGAGPWGDDVEVVAVQDAETHEDRGPHRPLVVISEDSGGESADEVEIIGQRDLAQEGGPDRPPRSHFHLHVPTGRVLMSHAGGVPPPRTREDQPIRIHRVSPHDEAYRRHVLRRQERLRRQLEASLSRRTFRNAVLESTDEDDDDYSPSTSVGVSDAEDTDLQVLGSTSPPRSMGPEYTPATISPLFRIRQMMGLDQTGLPRSEAVPPNVMRMIQLEEDRLEAKRYRKRKLEMRKVRMELEKSHTIPPQLTDRYTNDMGNGTIGCELCGVPLFAGPSSQGPSAQTLFEAGFRSPWNKGSLSQLDTDLAKTAYMAKCGHMYCGRCVHRIKTYLAHTGVEKRKLIQHDKRMVKEAASKDGTLPMEVEWSLTKNTAPSSCVGADCTTSFAKSAKAFYQLFT